MTPSGLLIIPQSVVALCRYVAATVAENIRKVTVILSLLDICSTHSEQIVKFGVWMFYVAPQLKYVIHSLSAFAQALFHPFAVDPMQSGR